MKKKNPYIELPQIDLFTSEYIKINSITMHIDFLKA